MSNEKKARGRPKGSSRYAQRDEQTMLVVADLIAANPNLTMTETIRRVIDTSRDTGGVRRLQGKLKNRIEGMVALSKARLIEVNQKEHVEQVMDTLDKAIPQILAGTSDFIRNHDREIRDFLFVMRKRNKPIEYLYGRLGVTQERLRELSQQLVALGIILRDFSQTDGMPHLENLLKRLSTIPWMVSASGSLATAEQAGDEGKAACRETGQLQNEG